MERYVYQLRIRRWIDGDTVVGDIDLGFGIVHTDQHFRLLGVDTPELRPRLDYDGDGVVSEADQSKRQEEIEAAIRARDFCAKHCPPDSLHIVRTHKDRSGKYGRWLIDIIFPYRNGAASAETLNAALILEGLATPAE